MTGGWYWIRALMPLWAWAVVPAALIIAIAVAARPAQLAARARPATVLRAG